MECAKKPTKFCFVFTMQKCPMRYLVYLPLFRFFSVDKKDLGGVGVTSPAAWYGQDYGEYFVFPKCCSPSALL